VLYRKKWGVTSTAAGAYQILFKTWQSLKGKDGLFSPENQDKAAIQIIKNQQIYNPRAAGVMADIQGGNIGKAATKLNGTWTSLPGGSEREMNLKQAQSIFKQAIVNELNGKSPINTPQGKLLDTSVAPASTPPPVSAPPVR
jgi:muramidase (phage lysozyme)